MKYKFRYRRLKGLKLWHTLKNVSGHKLENNLMVIYFADGSLRTIANWSECELSLDVDWVLSTKRQMERESGLDIKLAVEAK